MAKIAKELAESIYEIYSATVMTPVPFDEMFKADDKNMFIISDKVRGAYERGILKPDEQLFWIHNLNRTDADPAEPYDMGVLNALEVALLIFAQRDPAFNKKPESPVKLLEKLKKQDKSISAKLQKLAKEKDAQIRLLETKLHKEMEIGKMLKAELKKLKASKK